LEKILKVIKSDKKVKDLARVLEKRNAILAIQAIKKLREEESFEGAIGLLAAAFDEWTDKSVRKTIEDFFNDLKDPSGRPEVIAEIRKPLSQGTLSMLVASCWQSGLDYSDYMEEMVNIFLTGDYPTSIECMTVIGESAQDCSRKRKSEMIATLQDSTIVWTNEKKNLTLELIAILEE
jgi:hypothetical protein